MVLHLDFSDGLSISAASMSAESTCCDLALVIQKRSLLMKSMGVVADRGEDGPALELPEEGTLAPLPLALESSGHLGEGRGVSVYMGEETGVKNLVVVARLRNASMSRIVRLLCSVSNGFRDGTMLNPSNALNASGFR